MSNNSQQLIIDLTCFFTPACHSINKNGLSNSKPATCVFIETSSQSPFQVMNDEQIVFDKILQMHHYIYQIS